MIMGEEQKKIPEDDLLLSCTVEMLDFNTCYQIAVIDKIQMIADPHRGSGWTSAVLGPPRRRVPFVRRRNRRTRRSGSVKRYG